MFIINIFNTSNVFGCNQWHNKSTNYSDNNYKDIRKKYII
jgi:hypothetical protein